MIRYPSLWEVADRGRWARATIEALGLAAVGAVAWLWLRDRIHRGCGKRGCDPRRGESLDVASMHAVEYAAAVTLLIAALRILLAITDGDGPRRRTTALLVCGVAAAACGAGAAWQAYDCASDACATGFTPGLPWWLASGAASVAAGLAMTFFWPPRRTRMHPILSERLPRQPNH